MKKAEKFSLVLSVLAVALSACSPKELPLKDLTVEFTPPHF